MTSIENTSSASIDQKDWNKVICLLWGGNEGGRRRGGASTYISSGMEILKKDDWNVECSLRSPSSENVYWEHFIEVVVQKTLAKPWVCAQNFPKKNIDNWAFWLHAYLVYVCCIFVFYFIFRSRHLQFWYFYVMNCVSCIGNSIYNIASLGNRG